MADKVRLLVICGPTASGKTSAAISLAKQLDGEIVSADSMQIYQGLPIGTAQPTMQERQQVPHHLIDFLPPEQMFSVAQYVELATNTIADIAARGKTPIVVGGTGLYISSLIDGIQFVKQNTDDTVKQKLQVELQQNGIEPLYARLQTLDPAYALTVHPNNHGRVLRALALYEQTGLTMTQQQAQSRPKQRPFDDVVIGLQWPREQLYRRIELRVDLMMQTGLLEEARQVYLQQKEYQTAAQAIGYKEFFPYIAGEDSLVNCIDKLKQSSRNYAKRQLTWLKRIPHLHWCEPQQIDTMISLWKQGEPSHEKKAEL